MAKKIILSILIILVLGATVYFIREKAVERASMQAASEERRKWQTKAGKLEDKITLLEEEVQRQNQEIDTEKIAEVFGGTSQKNSARGTEAEKTSDKVKNFFAYLDEKRYLPENGIHENSFEYFMSIIEALKKSQPVISGETKDLFTLIKNITYFYRILGKEGILTIKAVLKGETDLIEPAMKIFYSWLNPWNADNKPSETIISPEVMYNYAAFFLQTIAGQSYLFRRDSKTRILTLYYCVIIIDQADKRDLNSYGIDLRPHVGTLINSILSHKQISGKNDYLEKLRAIKTTF